MTVVSARLSLPLIAGGQAQKEMTHNEALALLDVAVQASVVAVGLDVPPPAPATGQCWIVGTGPADAWAGQAGAIAGWTAGGWRFVTPREGMAAWSAADGATARFAAGTWRVATPAGAIAAPAGGAVVDAEARAALAAILAVLRGQRLIAA